MLIFTKGMARNMHTINSPNSIDKEWEELQVLGDFGRGGAIYIRQVDICCIYWWGGECEKNLSEIPKKTLSLILGQ